MDANTDQQSRRPLADLGPAALGELRSLLLATPARRAAFLRGLMARPATPGLEALAELIAVCDQDPIARLEVLREIRDALDEPPRP